MKSPYTIAQKLTSPLAREMPYARRDRALFLDAIERRYTLAVRDLPKDERPREKILANGPQSLSMAELLAAVLIIGTTKEDVLAMSRRIMKEYGERNILEQKDAVRLASDLAIPIGKALQIVAIGELGCRLFSKNENGAPTIRTAREVFDYVGDMRALSKEHLRGLYLNTRYKVIHDEIISIGTLDGSMIHPREVFKPAIEYAAAAIILVHNHPSGNIEPSASDQAITKQLVRAGEMIGIDLIDHIIVTKNGYASIPGPYNY